MKRSSAPIVKEWNICYNTDEPWNIMLSKGSHTQKLCIRWFYLYEIYRKGKHITGRK